MTSRLLIAVICVSSLLVSLALQWASPKTKETTSRTQTEKKFLVYTSASHDFIRLVPLWAQALCMSHTNSSIRLELLVLTIHEKPLEQPCTRGLKVHFLHVGKKRHRLGAFYEYFLRFMVTQWREFSNFEAAIYADADVLVTRPLDGIFSSLKENKIHSCAEGQHNERFFSVGTGYSADVLRQLDKEKIRSMNSGLFAFRISKEMEYEFDGLLRWSELEIAKGTQHFLDQSFFNTWFNLRRLSDTRLLTPLVHGYLGTWIPKVAFRQQFVHIFSPDTSGRLSASQLANRRHKLNKTVTSKLRVMAAYSDKFIGRNSFCDCRETLI